VYKRRKDYKGKDSAARKRFCQKNGFCFNSILKNFSKTKAEKLQGKRRKKSDESRSNQHSRNHNSKQRQ
jgi:hypothetical protein